MPEAPPLSSERSRRWTVIAPGLLCGLLAVVVIYTKPNAFYSPIAVMIVAAIGLAAVLLQLRFYNREQSHPLHAPVWLNVLGILFAVAALFSDVLRLGPAVGQLTALGAIAVFSISSALVLHAFRKQRIAEK
jgi:drug/metabolite transporter (DMT)-like permease